MVFWQMFELYLVEVCVYLVEVCVYCVYLVEVDMCTGVCVGVPLVPFPTALHTSSLCCLWRTGTWCEDVA